jgi:hypothetical protein
LSRGGKQTWRVLYAKTFKEAQNEAEVVETGVVAQARGLTVAGLADPNRITLAKAIDSFLDHAEKSKKRKAVNGYRLNLQQFQKSTTVKYVDEVVARCYTPVRRLVVNSTSATYLGIDLRMQLRMARRKFRRTSSESDCRKLTTSALCLFPIASYPRFFLNSSNSGSTPA